MSSTIILSKPEGPKELLMTFEMAWVASTTFHPLVQLTSLMFWIQRTILLPDIGTGDFLPTQDCVRDASVPLK
jgi:hypothetical protein